MFGAIPSPPVEQEDKMANQKHMDLKQRVMIENSLNDGKSFKTIGKELDKDCTTISKEVRLHKVFEKKGTYGRSFNDCANRTGCPVTKICLDCNKGKNARCCFCGKCTVLCDDYKKETCPKLSKPPYVCNGCDDRKACTLEKAFYRAVLSQNEYEELKSESRSGYAISEAELAHLNNVVSPLIRKGQSLHHIVVNHLDEIMCSERTLYSYVNDGLLDARNIDMPRKVKLRPRKGEKADLKVDKACRVGRTYQDFLAFMEEHPGLPVIEFDTVEGVKGGACLLTIHFVTAKLQLAYRRAANDSQSVLDIVDRLYLELRPDVFMELFPVILADNGSEFSNPQAIEFDRQGNRRTYVFYCNPSSPFQKGACENNHEFIRRIIPKGTDISPYTEEQVRLMMSHINSYGRKELGDKSPYELFRFFHNEVILRKFGLAEVPRDEINLTPGLFVKQA